MNLVISTTCYGTAHRIEGFLKNISECHSFEDALVLVVNTGPSCSYDVPKGMNHAIRNCVDIPRAPTSAMYEKVRVAKEFCNKDTIYMCFDDDYALNPYVLDFVKTIFEENPIVNYMAPVISFGNDIPPERQVVLSGFDFAKVGGCLGGSLMARWSHFEPMVDEYFEINNIDGERPGQDHSFDIEFLTNFLPGKTGTEFNIYCLRWFSLVQHCNMVSTWLSYRAGLLDHTYCQNFDPRTNPFQIRDMVRGE
jgi:hypothetical protein